MTSKQLAQLQQRLPLLTTNEPLARHATIRVGGPAAAFLVTRTIDELISAVTAVRELKIASHILGGGSNTLFSDRGFDGLVIKNTANALKIGEQVEQLAVEDWQGPPAEIRHEAADPSKYISFLDLNYEERPGDTAVVAESGVNLTAAIIKTINAGLTGLQWFAGIPGVVGGAVYNNIHGGTHFIGQRIESVTALTPAGEQVCYSHDQLAFGYDSSRFHESGEIILKVTFLLTKAVAAEIERADYTFREWTKRKGQMQPKLGTMGSTFQNIDQATREKIGAPTTAAGWLIDQCGLKGHQLGQAQIAPEHANFIVNLGGACAQEVYGLMQLAQKAVKQKFGVDLKPEVFLVGQF